MAENIPFVHTLALGIMNSFPLTAPHDHLFPTVLAAVCLSTIINGLLFFIVGYLKLGNTLHFFPRHVILGMTAGFGVFLLLTAFEISTSIAVAEVSLIDIFGLLTWGR